MPQADSINTTNPPISRRDVESQIDLLICLLDTLDADPDLEPSLGFSTGGHRPEDQPQEGDALHLYWDAGDDHEDEHTGEEPDVDAENSLGWGQGDRQEGQWSVVTDLEEGIGAVRKQRPASKTGGKVCRGCEVLA